LTVFWINPAKNTHSPKLVEFISLNPKTFVGDYIYALTHVMLTIYNGCKLPSTNYPSLTFASPLAKLNSINGSGVASMLSLLKSTHAFKQEFSSGLESTNLTFKLTHITFNQGAS
jgi:hypothetical protein